MKLVTVILLVFLWNVCLAQEYAITRKEQDIFEIPASMCYNTVQQCNEMDANQLKDAKNIPVNCTCQCNANVNVFGFFNNTWKCEKNSDVRTHASCSIIHLNEDTVNSPLNVVPVNQSWIGNVQGTSCTLQDQFSYLDCNGTWKQRNKAGVGFFLYWYENTLPNLFGLYDNGENSIASYQPKIGGHIIKLNIRCTSSALTHHCVLLKVSGQLTCPVLIPTTSKVSSSTTNFPSSSDTLSTTMPPLMSTSSSSVSQKPLSTILFPDATSSPFSSQRPSTSNSSASVTRALLPTTKLESTNSLQTTVPLLKKGKNGSSTADKTGLIAGTVGGGASLLVIAMVLLIMNRKRNSTTVKTHPEEIHDNDYEQPVDNDLTHTGQQSSNGNQQNQQDPPQIPEVYITLEDPDYVESEPVYNILEGPGNEESNYDVVGEMMSTDGPVYDVLEGPESVGQHVYGSLEAKEPHLYGSLNCPDAGDRAKPPSQGGGVYQELNPETRLSSYSEYQPLTYSETNTK